MTFRRDPVPRVGRRWRWRWQNFFKYPKTYQEIRSSSAAPAFVRPKRRANHLPDGLEDRHRGDFGNRCWKNNKKRRKQWMRDNNKT